MMDAHLRRTYDTACRTIDGHRVVTEPNFIEAQCIARRMRMTEQRRVIARVLADSADHPDVEELYRRCAKIDEHISISTVYRTVKLDRKSTRLNSSHSSPSRMPSSA